MKPVRTAARALLASIFVVSGVKILLDPESKVPTAKRVTDRVGPLIAKIDSRLPTDARSLVRAKAAADVTAGLLLASGKLTRPAAAVLAAGLVPTTLAGHPFWTMPQPERGVHQTNFLKNLGLLGGLLLAAADTEGKPSIGYRTSHAVDRSQHTIEHAVRRSKRSMKRAVRTARREAKIATRSAAAARKLPG
jgi:putative oxidoreductase